MAFQSNSNNAWIFYGTNGNLNNNNRYNAYTARVFRDLYLQGEEGFENAAVPLSELYEIYIENRRGKRGKDTQAKFEAHYPVFLQVIWWQLRHMEAGQQNVMNFIIHYPKPRQVVAEYYYGKMFQNLFCKELHDSIEARLDEASCSCRIGRGGFYAIDQFRMMMRRAEAEYGRCLVFKIDQKSFFLHIDKLMTYEHFVRIINEDFEGSPKREVLLWLARMIYLSCPVEHSDRYCEKWEYLELPQHKLLENCGWDTGLSLGNPTAQMAGNLKSGAILRALRECGVKYLIHYTDDIFGIIPYALKYQFLNLAYPYLRDVETAEKLEMNEKKHYLQDMSRGVPMLGFFVKKDKVVPNGRAIHNLRNKIRLHNIWQQQGLVYCIKEAPHYAAQINSYFGWFRFGDTYELRKRMASEIMTGLWAEIFVMDREYKKVVVKKQYQYKTYLIKRNIQHRRFINDYSRTDYEPSVRTART